MSVHSSLSTLLHLNINKSSLLDRPQCCLSLTGLLFRRRVRKQSGRSWNLMVLHVCSLKVGGLCLVLYVFSFLLNMSECFGFWLVFCANLTHNSTLLMCSGSIPSRVQPTKYGIFRSFLQKIMVHCAKLAPRILKWTLSLLSRSRAEVQCQVQEFSWGLFGT